MAIGRTNAGGTDPGSGRMQSGFRALLRRQRYPRFGNYAGQKRSTHHRFQ